MLSTGAIVNRRASTRHRARLYCFAQKATDHRTRAAGPPLPVLRNRLPFRDGTISPCGIFSHGARMYGQGPWILEYYKEPGGGGEDKHPPSSSYHYFLRSFPTCYLWDLRRIKQNQWTLSPVSSLSSRAPPLLR